MIKQKEIQTIMMQKAVEEAKRGIELLEGGPFGAVVVMNNQIIGKGHNEVIGRNDPTAHAEIEAIRDACTNLKQFDLHGSIMYSICYPCPMCLCAIMWARITKVYYSLSTQDIELLGFDDSLFYSRIIDSTYKKTLLHQIINTKPLCLEVIEEYANGVHKHY